MTTDLTDGLAKLRERLKVYLDPRQPVSKRSAQAWRIADQLAILMDEIEKERWMAAILNGSGP
jgi:hypothetical protein